MPIRPLAPEECPSCGAVRTMFVNDSNNLECSLCAYQQEEKSLKPEPKKPTPVKPDWTPSYAISHPGSLQPWARTKFNTGQDCIRQKDWAGAIKAFQAALQYQPDFLDAHLWIVRLADDEKVKRHHLDILLSHNPNHMEGLRELMVLNGRLTEEEAARADHYNDPIQRQLNVAVGAKTQVLSCPVCEGDLTEDVERGIVLCAYCGYQTTISSKVVGEDSLAMALIERKAKAVQWKIGERFLHCNNCAADRTIPGTKLSTRCPFCGSNHVIERDALKSFQQPDGLIAFEVTRDAAAQAIRDRLDSAWERMKGFFGNNKVKQAVMNGVYMPFWVFDAVANVTRTTIDKRSDQARMQVVNPYQREQFTDLINDIAVCGVTSPSPDLTARIGHFDMHSVRPYTPDLLAKYPAELYQLDFDKASIEARGHVSEVMREKYGYTPENDVQINIFSAVQSMTFQLVLMPVYVATLLEEDGDVRLALVNGQTGHTVLGKAQKQGK